MRALFVALSLFCLCACQSANQKSDQTQADTTAVITDTVAQTEKPSNFFVLTSWATTDRNKALAHVPNQQKQLMGLWRNGLVENIYYNQKGKFSDGLPLPLIGFVLKGLTETEARKALDTTDVVKTNLANYSLHPVGQSVFGRSEKALSVSAAGNETYAVIWAFLVKRDSLDRAVLGEQAILNNTLQQEGIIENGYIDLRSPTANTGGTQPAVYFINAKSEADAHKVLDAMPLVKSKQAVYGLHYVGQFLAGSSPK